jgi:hypothetical protein
VAHDGHLHLHLRPRRLCCNGEKLVCLMCAQTPVSELELLDDPRLPKQEWRMPACQCQTLWTPAPFILHCTRKELGSSVYLSLWLAVGTAYVGFDRGSSSHRVIPCRYTNPIFPSHRPAGRIHPPNWIVDDPSPIFIVFRTRGGSTHLDRASPD